MDMIINGDSLHELKELADGSIDFICTDPPYGYSFMGKDWDKAVPSVEIWQECLRVLKPGAFCCVMSAPRSDVQNAMISRLMEAGFRLDFTPIYWTYASGFPKAGNIGKLVDKRLGAEREVVGTRQSAYGSVVTNQDQTSRSDGKGGAGLWTQGESKEVPLTGGAASTEAKALDGSYAGFQPKPAVEVIIVAMKPLSEKTYVDQALANGKGITWLDDVRIPTSGDKEPTKAYDSGKAPFDGGTREGRYSVNHDGLGRFPANLLVSDDVLNDGVVSKSAGGQKNKAKKMIYGGNSYNDSMTSGDLTYYAGDSGSYSRYFDLDKWAATLAELQPKAYNRETWISDKTIPASSVEPSLMTTEATRQDRLMSFALASVTPTTVSVSQSPSAKSAEKKPDSTETSIVPSPAPTRQDMAISDETSPTSAGESITATTPSKPTENSPNIAKDVEKLRHTLNDIIQICQNLQASYGSVSRATGELKQQEADTARLLKLLENLPEQQRKTFPFAIFPKASKGEKNKGLDGFEARGTGVYDDDGYVWAKNGDGTPRNKKVEPKKNHHPTVKPLKLMSYLITLFSREGDTVLDPFVGSGTTVVAAQQLGRQGIGIEREAEYAEIARARLAHVLPEEPMSVPPVTMDEILHEPVQITLF